MKKTVIIFSVLVILFLGLTSAVTDKSFNKDIGKYGKVELTNRAWIDIFGWFEKPIERIELKENTDNCGSDCYAIKDIELLQTGRLVDSVKFNSRNRQGQIYETEIQYQFYLKDGINWVEYDFEELPPGNYTLKLEGKKDIRQDIDWIIISQGKEITEWYWWLGVQPSAYWNFDYTLTDISGNDLTLTPGTGNSFSSVYKLGNGSRLYAGTNPDSLANESFNFSTGDFTFGYWMNTSITNDGIIGVGSAFIDNGGWAMRISGGTLRFEKSSNIILSTPSSGLSDEDWHRIIVTRNSTGLGLFADGTLVYQNTTDVSDFYRDDLKIAGLSGAGFYDGLLDDVFIYKGYAWSESDVTYDYNSGVGRVLGTPFFAELNSPEDGFTSPSNSIIFNSTSFPIGLTIVNASLFHNATGSFELNDTLELTGEFNESIFTKTFSNGNYIWNELWCYSDGSCEFTEFNRTFSIDTTNPIITINEPSSILDYGYLGKNETLNVTVNSLTLNTCWYNYGDNTNYTFTCSSGSESISSFIYDGNDTIQVYANSTSGNIGNENISFNYKVFENNFTYNNQTLVGSKEDFSLNLDILAGYEISSAYFRYGSYNQTPSIYSSTGNSILNITNYAIPSFPSDTNVTLYFDLTLDDSTQINTMNYTQLVSTINLDDCSSYTNSLFNVTLVDEITQEILNGDVEFYYSLLNVPFYEIIGSSNLALTNVSNFEVCSDVNLTNQDYVQSIEIRYVSDGYAPELYHIQRAEISPSTRNITLYDLNESKSTEFKITYQDNTFNFVGGAVVQLKRRYISENAYKVVEAPLTSNEGTAVVHIDLDSIQYQASIVKDGVVLDNFDNIVFKCQSILTGECEQKLLGQIDPQNSIDYDTQRDFSYSVIQGNNSIEVLYSIPSSLPSSVNIFLQQRDQWGNTTSCNKTIVSSGGSVECNYDDSLDISYLELQISKDGVPISYNNYIIDTDTGIDFLDNNYIIVTVLILSVVGMGLTSPEWIIVNAIIILLFSGMIWLVNGISFTAGLGILMWLLIAAIILILKLSKQEDR